MDEKDLVFLGACMLVTDPDDNRQLHRRDSIAAAAMRQAILTARMLYQQCTQMYEDENKSRGGGT